MIFVCQIFHLPWCYKPKYVSNPADRLKVAIKSETLTLFGGIFSKMEQFDSALSSVIGSALGLRCELYGCQYGGIIRSLMSVVCLRGGSWRKVKCMMLAFRPPVLGDWEVLCQTHVQEVSRIPSGRGSIGDLIVGIGDSDGNTSVRSHREDTLNGFFGRLERKGMAVNRLWADCGFRTIPTTYCGDTAYCLK